MNINHTLHVTTGSNMHKKLATALIKAAELKQRPIWHYNANSYFIDDVKEVTRMTWLVTFSNM